MCSFTISRIQPCDSGVGLSSIRLTSITSRIQGIHRPYTRNWSRLADLSGIYNRLNESQREFLDILEPLNIEARYPTHKDAILKSLTREECELLVGETKELSEWIKSQL